MHCLCIDVYVRCLIISTLLFNNSFFSRTLIESLHLDTWLASFMPTLPNLPAFFLIPAVISTPQLALFKGDPITSTVFAFSVQIRHALARTLAFMHGRELGVEDLVTFGWPLHVTASRADRIVPRVFRTAGVVRLILIAAILIVGATARPGSIL